MIENIKADLKKAYIARVDRLNHIYGVRQVARLLGKIHHVDLDKIDLAVYLHDLTKYESNDFHEQWIKKTYNESILKAFSKPLHHAFSAAAVAQHIYDIKDEDIIHAIESHTVGRPAMSTLEKIIFISDYIEPHRLYASCVNVREIAFHNLDLAVYMAIDESIRFFEKDQGFIPDVAYQARSYYKPKGEPNE